jgi:hypothetical protein
MTTLVLGVMCAVSHHLPMPYSQETELPTAIHVTETVLGNTKVSFNPGTTTCKTHYTEGTVMYNFNWVSFLSLYLRHIFNRHQTACFFTAVIVHNNYHIK